MSNNDVDKWIKNRKPHQVIPFSILNQAFEFKGEVCVSLDRSRCAKTRPEKFNCII